MIRLASYAVSYFTDQLMMSYFSGGSILNCPPGGDRWARVLGGQSGWLSEPTRRVLLRAGGLLLLLLLTAESRERRCAVCGMTFKITSNGAESNNDLVSIRTPENSAAPKVPSLKNAFH